MSNFIHLEGETVEINGATKVVSSAPAQAVIEMGEKSVVLTGEGIEVKSLDLDNKKVLLFGHFANIKIGDAGAKKGSLIKRIFK